MHSINKAKELDEAKPSLEFKVKTVDLKNYLDGDPEALGDTSQRGEVLINCVLWDYRNNSTRVLTLNAPINFRFPDAIDKETVAILKINNQKIGAETVINISATVLFTQNTGTSLKEKVTTSAASQKNEQDMWIGCTSLYMKDIVYGDTSGSVILNIPIIDGSKYSSTPYWFINYGLMDEIRQELKSLVATHHGRQLVLEVSPMNFHIMKPPKMNLSKIVKSEVPSRESSIFSERPRRSCQRRTSVFEMEDSFSYAGSVRSSSRIQSKCSIERSTKVSQNSASSTPIAPACQVTKVEEDPGSDEDSCSEYDAFVVEQMHPRIHDFNFVDKRATFMQDLHAKYVLESYGADDETQYVMMWNNFLDRNPLKNVFARITFYKMLKDFRKNVVDTFMKNVNPKLVKFFHAHMLILFQANQISSEQYMTLVLNKQRSKSKGAVKRKGSKNIKSKKKPKKKKGKN